ncbi:hypothetical protein C0995_012931 [Termitomyces sp. Mi166|nr:hypothetical protein C0995_012931 [Termitomyces sp. Mi166\
MPEVSVKLTFTDAPTDVPLRPRAKINSSAQPLRSRTPRPIQPKVKLNPSPSPRRHTDARHSPSPSASLRIKSKVTPVATNPHRYTPRSHSYRNNPDPPHSPPTSTVSFSSRSESAVSSRNGDDEHLRSTLTNLFTTISADETTDDDSKQNLKAEAKSNRKIADLEITNRSLLAINASLETTKHKQSKEIRDLRRKLRESRLILPPRAFRAANASDANPAPLDDSDDEEEEDETKDEVYVRIKAMLDGLLETGRRALESQPADFVQGSKGATKVLSADEVREAEDTKDVDVIPVSMDTSLDSEDEVERTLVHSTTPSPPPIHT